MAPRDRANRLSTASTSRGIPRIAVCFLIVLAFIHPSNSINGRFEISDHAAVYLNNEGGIYGQPLQPVATMITRRTSETAAWLPHRAAEVTKVGLAAYETTLDVIFSIKQNNLDALESFVQQAADPHSPLFGRRKTRAEVAAWTANPDGKAKVIAFLTAAGADIVAETRHGEYITARGTAGLWSALLSARFYVFRAGAELSTAAGATSPPAGDASAAAEFVRAEAYAIPEALQPHVAAVFNTVQMPAALRWPAAGVVTSGPYPSLPPATPPAGIRTGAGTGTGRALASSVPPFVTPAAIRQAYGARPGAHGSPHSAVAVYASLGQSFSPADLRAFCKHFRLPPQNVSTVVGGHRSDAACVAAPRGCAEANLDLQWAAAVAQGAALEVRKCATCRPETVRRLFVSALHSQRRVKPTKARQTTSGQPSMIARVSHHLPPPPPTPRSTGTTPARPSPTGQWPWPTRRARAPSTACRTACPRPT